jgi:hypothetical protein
MPPNTPAEPLRVALVSTPRSGNTWVRRLVAAAYDLAEAAAHRHADALQLPPRVAFQIHARREPEFCDWVRRHGFRVATIARHPLDVLISILQFAVHAPSTREWLDGRSGGEEGIWGATPRSRAFIEYATGPRAAELLAVSADWWREPGVVPVRYEDVVADPTGWLTGLAAWFGPPRVEPTGVVPRFTLDEQRRGSANSHFWQGRPGLWRALLPAAEAEEIQAAHRDVFAALGYRCDPDPDLTPSAADRNWVRLAGPALSAALETARAA